MGTHTYRIKDPTTGEVMMIVCTRGALSHVEIEAIAAVTLLRMYERTKAQDEWLNNYLRETE